MKVFANANRLKILIYLSYFHIYKSIAKRYHHYAFCISALCIFVVRQHDKYEVFSYSTPLGAVWQGCRKNTGHIGNKMIQY